jgi:hypothetical protein
MCGSVFPGEHLQRREGVRGTPVRPRAPSPLFPISGQGVVAVGIP